MRGARGEGMAKNSTNHGLFLCFFCQSRGRGAGARAAALSNYTIGRGYSRYRLFVVSRNGRDPYNKIHIFASFLRGRMVWNAEQRPNDKHKRGGNGAWMQSSGA